MSMKTSKGLSSVVGAVLLITISVGAAASAWTFIDTVTSTTRDNVENRIEDRNRQSKSEMSSDIAYNSSDGFIILTIRNSGASTLLIRDNGDPRLNMYVRGRPVNGDPKSWKFLNPQPSDVALQPEESISLNTTSPFPPQGEDYVVKLTGPAQTSTTYICYNSGTASC